MLAERLHARVHLGTVLLAVRLLLAQLLAHATQHALHRVQVALLRLRRNVQLHLRNADRAVVALDHLAVQVLPVSIERKEYNLVRNGQLVAHATLLDGRAALDFVRLESAVRA